MEILNNFNTSVEKALTEIDPQWRELPGLIVCGSHAPKNTEETILKIQHARITNLPFLGICMGFQLMAIEYARNEAGLLDANTQEVDHKTTVPIICKMPQLRVGMMEAAWDSHLTKESFWHNYEFNTNYLRWFKRDWDIEEAEGVVTFMKLRKNFVGCQFHPEYESRIGKPHLLLKQHLDECKLAM